jgi:peptide/nickel transport system substrate-binding protein
MVVLAVAGILSAACGSSSANSVSKPPTDHVLHVSFLQDPGQPPDPDIYYAGEGLLLTTNTYEGLLQYQAGIDTPKIAPLLATSWTASPDNKVYTFQLRQGVFFHDGTPFTSAAVKASFDRRLAVNQGPAYMVSDIDSVTTQGDSGVTITLKDSNSAFLDYLASAYGPKMMSPTALKEQAGSDNAQTYLRTHDVGTGPYMLTDASVGSHYAMKAFDKYWGPKPYFTSVDIPVLTDLSTQQLQFDKGQIAVIMHDLSASATQSYLKNSNVKTYSMPTLISDYVYVNPNSGFLTTQSNRMALLQAIDVKTIFNQVFSGRATIADQAYPAHMMPAGDAKQNIPYQSSALQNLVKTLPADQKTITIGYDSSQADNQLVANLVSAQLLSLGLTAKVQSYPTSQIFGWVSDAKGAPDVLLSTGWPDAAPPYTWAHISFDPDGGLNYLHCSDQQITNMLPDGLHTGSAQTLSKIGELSSQTGCWDNLVDENDFMVAQPWLKGVAQSHVITVPMSLNLAGLSVG